MESVEERQAERRRVRFTGVFRCVSHKCQKLRETNTRKSFYTKSVENLGAYGIYYARIIFSSVFYMEFFTLPLQHRSLKKNFASLTAFLNKEPETIYLLTYSVNL